MQLVLTDVRLQSWGGQIWTPKGFEGADEAYGAHFIFGKQQKHREKGTLLVDMINVAIESATKDKFGTKAAMILKQATAAGKLPLHDGELKADKDGYAGNLYLAARRKTSKKAPTVLHRKAKNPDGSDNFCRQQDGVIYDGCYVDAIVDIYAYDTGSNGVTADLQGVRFIKDGDAFGSGAPVRADDFGDVEDEADIEL